MKYLPNAFEQLKFAIKLQCYGLDGKINRQDLDVSLTSKDGRVEQIMHDQIFSSDDELLIALEKNVLVAFGVAAITLNRAREERHPAFPENIDSENEQCIGLIYQIRNAFAHDIIEPRWEIRHQKYQREYNFGGIQVDLSNVHKNLFEYKDIGGANIFFEIKEYADQNILHAP